MELVRPPSPPLPIFSLQSIEYPELKGNELKDKIYKWCPVWCTCLVFVGNTWGKNVGSDLGCNIWACRIHAEDDKFVQKVSWKV